MECIIDAIVATSPNAVYDALPMLAKKGNTFEAGLIDLCCKVYSLCNPLGLRCIFLQPCSASFSSTLILM